MHQGHPGTGVLDVLSRERNAAHGTDTACHFGDGMAEALAEPEVGVE
jgi:hypothetical protein